MKYLILMHINLKILEDLSEEQQRMIEEGHSAFLASAKASGEFISTQALGDPRLSKVVRGTNDQPEVTDGPFVVAKEFLGGFYLLDVEDETRAIELATRIPDARLPGLAVEIRPVVFSDLGDQ